MPDSPDWDLWESRLSRFASECRDPAPRALAIARFLLALPGGLSRTYYLHEWVPRLRDAVGSNEFQSPDPESREDIRGALARSCEDGVLAVDAAATLFGRLDQAARTPAIANRPESPEPASTRAAVPVVLDLPSPDARDQPAATIVWVEVYPYPARPELPQVRWIARRVVGRAQTEEANEQLFHEVAGAALAGARVVAAARFRGRGFRRLLRGTPELRFDWLVGSRGTGDVVGRSIGLGLAIQFLGAFRGAAHRGRGFRPRSDIAWTGCLTPSGLVEAVAAHSLRAKVRAAAFSGFVGIVVPRSQLSLARAAVPTELPEFVVTPIDHLDELL